MFLTMWQTDPKFKEYCQSRGFGILKDGWDLYNSSVQGKQSVGVWCYLSKDDIIAGKTSEKMEILAKKLADRHT